MGATEAELLYYYMFFFATLQGMWDLNPPTRDQTQYPLHWRHEVLTTGPLGKS